MYEIAFPHLAGYILSFMVLACVSSSKSPFPGNGYHTFELNGNECLI